MYLDGFKYKAISTAATTDVKSGPGKLHTIVVNSLGTVASTITTGTVAPNITVSYS